MERLLRRAQLEPYAREVTRLLGPPVAAGDRYTAQYAVPGRPPMPRSRTIKSIAGAGVVEVKKFAAAVGHAPGAAAMCFNMYVAAPAPPWVLGVGARKGGGRGGAPEGVVPRRPFSVSACD